MSKCGKPHPKSVCKCTVENTEDVTMHAVFNRNEFNCVHQPVDTQTIRSKLGSCCEHREILAAKDSNEIAGSSFQVC